jgi:hypothetical protein
MTHQIIKKDNYLLLVDELSNVNENIGDVFKESKDGITKTYKMIAHLSLNNAPTLEGVPLLPPLEDDVKKLCPCIGVDFKVEWINGYNKAKEKYKWTDDDVIRIVKKSRETGLTAEYLIQSLQQPKYPVAFECEMEFIDNHDFMDFEEEATTLPSSIESIEQPKTITNSQGLTQIVGKYIY